MTGKVFISYRRDDVAGDARGIHERLVAKFGRANVFMDVGNLLAGQRFDKELDKELETCDVLIAVIGPRWMDLLAERMQGGERDYVRAEIAAALKRGIVVIPVLVGQEGRMPSLPPRDQLPEDIRDLVLHQKHGLTHERFQRDIADLMAAIAAVRRKGQGPGRWPMIGAAGIAALLLAAAVAWQAGVLPPRSHGVADDRDAALSVTPGSGTGFRDRLADGQPCPTCPEMVVAPAGRFTMGSPESEPERESVRKGSESPQLAVRIAKPLAVGRFAVTRGEFAVFAKETSYKAESGCRVFEESPEPKLAVGRSWRSSGFAPEDRHPIVCVKWDDAKAYVEWLAKKTGKPYRLLSETEREYVTRAGTTTPFWWGSAITPEQANYDGAIVYTGGGVKGASPKRPVLVDSFKPNPWGLYNVHGNVWDWTSDCWNDSHDGNPADGSVRTSADCALHVLRGGSWVSDPGLLRSAARTAAAPGIYENVGFRVARTVGP